VHAASLLLRPDLNPDGDSTRVSWSGLPGTSVDTDASGGTVIFCVPPS